MCLCWCQCCVVSGTRCLLESAAIVCSQTVSYSSSSKVATVASTSRHMCISGGVACDVPMRPRRRTTLGEGACLLGERQVFEGHRVGGCDPLRRWQGRCGRHGRGGWRAGREAGHESRGPVLGAQTPILLKATPEPGYPKRFWARAVRGRSRVEVRPRPRRWRPPTRACERRAGSGVAHGS